MNQFPKIFKWILLVLLFFFSVLIYYFFIGKPPQADEITWGVNFSQKYSQDLGLDWKETYLALLDDLGVKNIKLITNWDLIEPREGEYNFEDLDWQIVEAEKRDAKIILVIGMKTGRWPECHLPAWAENLNKEVQQKEISELLEKIVLIYRHRVSVKSWQVENEPFFPFGECPWRDKEFLGKEISLVKSLDDQKRPIVVTDSGEFSFWIDAAQLADIVGTTLHRKVYFTPFRNFQFLTGFKEFGFYVHYPFSPTYYWRKSQIIKKLFNKKVIGAELQAEPWCRTLSYDCSIAEQEKTMNLEQFQKNIEFAKKTGFDTFYLWGAEWWYWLKVKNNLPEIWEEVKKLFNSS